uniref:Uncharacterized protein n=1 Tax=Amphimedon queenslandica TaxID=400682 RepID=A0A1X7U2A0_AMPQE
MLTCQSRKPEPVNTTEEEHDWAEAARSCPDISNAPISLLNEDIITHPLHLRPLLVLTTFKEYSCMCIQLSNSTLRATVKNHFTSSSMVQLVLVNRTLSTA